jgi:hypothetical protein
MTKQLPDFIYISAGQAIIRSYLVLIRPDWPKYKYIVKGDSSLCIDDLLRQRFNSLDDSLDGRRKLEDNLTEINFRNSRNVLILVDHLRAKSDGKLAG